VAVHLALAGTGRRRTKLNSADVVTTRPEFARRNRQALRSFRSDSAAWVMADGPKVTSRV
jgi:hypothetical protein